MQYFARFLSVFFLLFAVAAPVFALTPEFRSKPVITIAADNWCPINCGRDDQKKGVGIDLAKAIFEPMGYAVEYRIMPWADALEKVRSGQVDAVVGASRFDDASLVFPRQAIYSITDNFYVLKGNSWRFQGVHTLKGKKLGVIKDYGYGNAVSEYIRTNSMNYAAVQAAEGDDALRINIKKLQARQIDVLVESAPVMEYTLGKMRLNDSIDLAGSSPHSKVFIAFSPMLPGSRGFAAQFDAGMQQLEAAGKLDAFYRAYGLSTYER